MIVVSALTAAPTSAQTDRAQLPDPTLRPIRFEHLGLEDGMSQSSGFSLLQDRHGFIWIGTEGGGVNRYDGYSFSVYAPVPFDSTSLSNGEVRVLYESDDGAIWVGTAGGLNRRDPETGAFRRFTSDPDDERTLDSDGITAIRQAPQGGLWVGTDRGLNLLEDSSGYVQRIPLPFPDSPHAEAVILRRGYGDGPIDDIYVDGNGHTWVSAGGHLFGENGEPGSPNFELVLPATGSRIYGYMLERPEEPEVLWISGFGLTRYDMRTGASETYFPSTAQRTIDLSSLAANAMHRLVQDPSDQHVLWLGTLGSGLLRFDVRDRTFRRFRHDPRLPHSLNGDVILDLMVDRTGIVWIGTSVTGVARFDPTGPGFEYHHPVPGRANSLPGRHVRGIDEDARGGLWIAVQDNGVSRLDLNTETYEHWTIDPDDPDALQGIVWAVHVDREGQVWIGTQGPGGGLSRVDPESGNLTHYRQDLQRTERDVPVNINRIYDDQHGTLWVGAEELYRFDRTSESFSRVGGDREVRSFYEDRYGRFWIATWGGGFGLLDRASDQITWYRHDPADTNSVSHARVNMFHERAREPGVLWIATYGGGLNRFDTKAGTFKHYTTEDGLADNVVYGILEDEDGRLWMSTNNGIASFDPETEAFRRFGMERGLQALEFNTNSYFKSARTGEMYFGGIEGLNSFRPSQLKPDETPPLVALSDLRVYNRRVQPGPNASIEAPIHLADGVRLRPDQDVVTFEFTALHFRHPSKNTYAYRLDGFNDDWVQAGTRREATFTNLDPGRYTFRVKAANADGVWNEEGTAIALNVLPPWWRTIWAYVFYGLLLVGAVVAVDRVQRRRVLQKERERSHRELEEAYEELERTHRNLKTTQAQLIQQEKMASLGQLTAGVAHEIKNPLNFITNFADLTEELLDELRTAIDGGDDVAGLLDDLQKNAAVIGSHGRRADEIVRGMMDHAHGGSGEREEVDLNGLVDEYAGLAYHGKRAQIEDLDVFLDKDLDPDAGRLVVVPQEIGRVLLNLIGNALDAVHERKIHGDGAYEPVVRVSTRRVDDRVRIRVSDNGPGIPFDMQKKIFEPFFTTKPTGSGTGLGLSLSYDIVTQGHGGSLEVESREGEGATFVATLPADRA